MGLTLVSSAQHGDMAPPQKAPIGVLATLAMTNSCGIVEARRRCKHRRAVGLNARCHAAVPCSARMAETRKVATGKRGLEKSWLIMGLTVAKSRMMMPKLWGLLLGVRDHKPLIS